MRGTEICSDDCRERAECESAGKPGHFSCGWCWVDRVPYHHCRHMAPMGADR